MLNQKINIKSKGFNQTIISDNNNNNKKRSKIDWNAHYDGDQGNISLNIAENNKKKHFDIQFNNDDLVQLFNIPSVDMSLEKRLRNDFLKKSNRTQKYRHVPMVIEVLNDRPLYDNAPDMFSANDSLQQLESPEIMSNNSNKLTHISSPTFNEELILPFTIKPISQRKKRAHKRHSKKVYKVLRVPKTYRKSRSSRSI